MNYRDLKTAADLFGIGERATLGQIKDRHREMVKAYHPDQKSDANPEMIRKINTAYEILKAYCENYRFCFSEEEFLEQVPEERLRRQFGWDSIWSGGPEE